MIANYVWDLTYSRVWNDSFIFASYHTYTRVSSNTWMHHVAHINQLLSQIWICVTWPIHMYDMTHLYVWHDAFTCVNWIMYMCDMTHSYAWHDSSICATWLIYTCDLTPAYRARLLTSCAPAKLVSTGTHTQVWLQISYVTWRIHTVTWLITCVTWLIHMCDITR